MQEGLKKGTLFQGSLTISHNNYEYAFVSNPVREVCVCVCVCGVCVCVVCMCVCVHVCECVFVCLSV